MTLQSRVQGWFASSAETKQRLIEIPIQETVRFRSVGVEDAATHRPGVKKVLRTIDSDTMCHGE